MFDLFWLSSFKTHKQTNLCSNKNFTDNRSIFFPSRSGFCYTFVHDAQDFSLCHWNIKKKAITLVDSSRKIISVSLLLELTGRLLDSLHDHPQRQTWDLHVSLGVKGTQNLFFIIYSIPLLFLKILAKTHQTSDTVPVKQWFPCLFLLIWSPCLPGNPLFPVRK